MRNRIKIFLWIFLILLTLSSCGNNKYEFLNGHAQISSIEIVKLGTYDAEKDAFNETVIVTIEDQDCFLAEFNKISFSSLWASPQGVFEDETVIKITYQNGEYELIDHDGQGNYQHFDGFPSNFDAYSGYTIFDQEQFQALIETYTN